MTEKTNPLQKLLDIGIRASDRIEKFNTTIASAIEKMIDAIIKGWRKGELEMEEKKEELNYE